MRLPVLGGMHLERAYKGEQSHLLVAEGLLLPLSESMDECCEKLDFVNLGCRGMQGRSVTEAAV